MDRSSCGSFVVVVVVTADANPFLIKTLQGRRRRRVISLKVLLLRRRGLIGNSVEGRRAVLVLLRRPSFLRLWLAARDYISSDDTLDRPTLRYIAAGLVLSFFFFLVVVWGR